MLVKFQVLWNHFDSLGKIIGCIRCLSAHFAVRDFKDNFECQVKCMLFILIAIWIGFFLGGWGGGMWREGCLCVKFAEAWEILYVDTFHFSMKGISGEIGGGGGECTSGQLDKIMALSTLFLFVLLF